MAILSRANLALGHSLYNNHAEIEPVQFNQILSEIYRIGINPDTLNENGAIMMLLFFNSAAIRNTNPQERTRPNLSDWEALYSTVIPKLDQRVQAAYKRVFGFPGEFPTPDLLECPQDQYDHVWNTLDRLRAHQIHSILAMQNDPGLPHFNLEEDVRISYDTRLQIIDKFSDAYAAGAQAFANELSIEQLVECMDLE
jgi:hypothetical protein